MKKRILPFLMFMLMRKYGLCAKAYSSCDRTGFDRNGIMLPVISMAGIRPLTL